MKYILTLITILFFNNMFSQTKEYPIYQVDEFGQKVVVITIAQANTLVNNSELLKLFREQSINFDSVDDVCLKVINDKEEVITKQSIEINKLEESVTKKDEKILVLQNEISEWVNNNSILNEKVSNRELVIVEKNKQIRTLKAKMLFGSIIATTIIILSFVIK